MPLELTSESIVSLQDGMHMDGNAIPVLLRHYNPSLNIDVLPTVSTMEQLEAQLGSIATDTAHNTYLISLNVNTVSKQFDEGHNNHYVGLVIKRQDNGQYAVQYIDPMGHGVSADVKLSLNSNLADPNITTYTGKLQYADIMGAGEEKEAVGNTNDCGPMLIYLLTKAAHEQELPTSQNIEESKNIGRGLRRQFLQDNGKEVYNHLTSNNRSVDLSVLQPRDLIAPEALKRRLDSFARLITGEDICTAVIFDGKNIRIANNNDHQSELIEKNLALFSAVAEQRYTLQEISLNHSLQQAKSSLMQEGITRITKKLNKKKNPIHPYKKQKMIQELEERSTIDLTKIISSLAEDSEQTKKFSDSFKDALMSENGGQVLFIRSREKGKHAEMTILDSVIMDGKIKIPDEEIVSGRKPLYIGITKLCCLDCQDAITAFNETSKTHRIVDSTIDPIETRGTHLGRYDGWVQPNFVTNNLIVLQKFQEIQSSRRGSLDKLKETAPHSPSSPETDHLIADAGHAPNIASDTTRVGEDDASLPKRMRREFSINSDGRAIESSSSAISSPSATPVVNRGGRTGNARGGRGGRR